MSTASSACDAGSDARCAMTDDTLTVKWDPTGRAPRRLRFEPRDAPGGAWKRIEEVYSGDECGWRPVGSELVESVVIEDGREYDAEATPAQTHLGDPRVDDDQHSLEDVGDE